MVFIWMVVKINVRGFYDGTNTECNDAFIAVVDKQTQYEVSYISAGPDANPTLKLKLELENMFEEYKACMSAAGANVYGNYISHLFGINKFLATSLVFLLFYQKNI